MKLFITYPDGRLQIFPVLDERMPVTAIGMNFHLENGDTLFMHPSTVFNLVLMSDAHHEEWMARNQQQLHEQRVDEIIKEKSKIITP